MAKVLIVDDSVVMRKNLRFILTKGGHEVVGEAMDGKQGIDLYFKIKPDLVTMDIKMPIMSGTGAAKFILDKDPKAKIIVISALNQKQRIFESLNNGVKNYIIKPIDPTRLLMVVNKTLETCNEKIEKIAL